MKIPIATVSLARPNLGESLSALLTLVSRVSRLTLLNHFHQIFESPQVVAHKKHQININRTVSTISSQKTTSTNVDNNGQ